MTPHRTRVRFPAKLGAGFSPTSKVTVCAPAVYALSELGFSMTITEGQPCVVSLWKRTKGQMVYLRVMNPLQSPSFRPGFRTASLRNSCESI